MPGTNGSGPLCNGPYCTATWLCSGRVRPSTAQPPCYAPVGHSIVVTRTLPCSPRPTLGPTLCSPPLCCCVWGYSAGGCSPTSLQFCLYLPLYYIPWQPRPPPHTVHSTPCYDINHKCICAAYLIPRITYARDQHVSMSMRYYGYITLCC